MIIKMKECCGTFAENKDIARELRENKISPIFDSSDEKIIFDFKGVDSSTQSFIHALISSFFQKYGEPCFDRFEFKSCSKSVKSLLETVVNYSLE